VLHNKLNEIIHPVWNLVKSESVVFYQRYFSRVTASDLLPALRQAGKTKSVDSILKLIYKGVAKLSKAVTKKYNGVNYFVRDAEWVMSKLAESIKRQSESAKKKDSKDQYKNEKVDQFLTD